MTDLTAKELDLLQRVEQNVDLQPLFFRKVKGLKWFNSLNERGYFNPSNNPAPVPAKEEGYVNISVWPITDYLVKTSHELSINNNQKYCELFLQILIDVTKYAKENDFSNYKTWWQFSQVLTNIPYQYIAVDDLWIIDYWLDDIYERGLVAQEIGEKWLPSLLNSNNEHALKVSLKILDYLYKIVIFERKLGERTKREAALRFDYYHAEKITTKVAELSGLHLGREAIELFEKQLIAIIVDQGNDQWSAIWRPAIEEHTQNKHRDDAENILVHAYRDSLGSYLKSKPDEAYQFVNNMLQSDYQIVHRLAIHATNANYQILSGVTDKLLDEIYLESNYRHEMWHFLKCNYHRFNNEQRETTLSLISSIERFDDDNNPHEGATAYNHAIWLAAIREHGENEEKLYQHNIKIAKTEPEHPDFSSYMSVGRGGNESPIPLDDLKALSIDDLIRTLQGYEDPGVFREPGLEGLVKSVRQLVKSEPLKYYLHLNKIIDLKLAYIHEVIEAYAELWNEDAKLPWNDLWGELLTFCFYVIKHEDFWHEKNTKEQKHFVANRYWIISSIGRLIQSGTRKDEHAFGEEYSKIAEDIINIILDNETGHEFNTGSDAVSIAINSPRGHCLEALINLALRLCRLSDKRNNKDHSEIWNHFQPRYDTELKLADSDNPEYEFSTLVTNYLPNFLYMSKDWVIDNLDTIFDQNNYIKWLCAMQGYSYVGTVYEPIFKFLKSHGDLLKALDDENLKDKVEERAIENIVVAYLNDFESIDDKDSLIRVILERGQIKEISHLIWFIWTLRKRDDIDLRNKVYELWPRILNLIDVETRDGRRLASGLCHWAVFVDHIDDERRTLLHAIAPYSDESHNSYELLSTIAEISKSQPYESYDIWKKMLNGSTPDYPEDAIRQLFSSLISEGPEGIRLARDIESEYLKKGVERPAIWLKELRKEMGV
ncbi:hypothetical protein [Thiomicrorhabdus sediminis]|uniref:DUF4020 domain-containing protein n=1 Tax=Thiomicrorhabdus sediminis TaxID=2580412 RepID=A0A4P9K7R6_9GAMM|nr:hypothetical protein [Thiomicrorhabdus sediminis]QCU90998.1 hypothetical protein FE785_10365 [Thiomicrorhabdus sediminis]